MNQVLIIVCAVAVAAASAIYAAASAYRQGYSDALMKQVTVDQDIRNRIMEEIRNETLDISNPAAVDCRLRVLAGDRVGEECRGL
jgi:hypothetical protein